MRKPIARTPLMGEPVPAGSRPCVGPKRFNQPAKPPVVKPIFLLVGKDLAGHVELQPEPESGPGAGDVAWRIAAMAASDQTRAKDDIVTASAANSLPSKGRSMRRCR